MRVWKFPLGAVEIGVEGAVTIEMPVGASVVHAGIQHGQIMLWAEVADTSDQARAQRTFGVFGTGMLGIPNHGQHVSTYFDGPFVWHVYEITVSDRF